MLITTCGHCRARFRVTPQQLNARQGQVRCGRCKRVFNGFESLERFPDDDTGTRLLAAREAEAEPGRGDAPAPSSTVDLPLEPSESVDLPLEPPESVDLPLEPADDAGIETLGSRSDAPSEPLPPVEPPAAPSRPLPEARPSRPAAELVLAPPRRKPLSRAWPFAAVLMAVVLLFELAYALRGPLAQRYPPLRPALEALCGYARCTVPWSREEGLLKLEESELLEVPGRPGEIALGARIRNLASVAQEYPYLELTLTDIGGQATARRVLRPTDYLGRPLAPGDVLAPGVELTMQLRLATPSLKATGYQLLLFYP